MPSIETAAMPKGVAGMARSYVPACTARQTKDFRIKNLFVKRLFRKHAVFRDGFSRDDCIKPQAERRYAEDLVLEKRSKPAKRQM
jgi:hypothetical protein